MHGLFCRCQERQRHSPTPDPAAYGAGWITKVGWLGSSRTYGWTRFGESGREFDAGAGRSRVVQGSHAPARRPRDRFAPNSIVRRAGKRSHGHPWPERFAAPWVPGGRLCSEESSLLPAAARSGVAVWRVRAITESRIPSSRGSAGVWARHGRSLTLDLSGVEAGRQALTAVASRRSRLLQATARPAGARGKRRPTQG